MARWAQIGNSIGHILNFKNHKPTTMKKIASLSTFVGLTAIVISSIGFAQQLTQEAKNDSKKGVIAPALWDSTKPSSTAIVQVHPSMLSISPLTNGGSGEIARDYMEKEFKAIVAPETLKIAAKTLKIDFEKDKNALADLKRKLRITPIRGTDFVKITAQGSDKKEATRIATAVSNAYIKRRTESEIAKAKEALTALDEELIKQSEVVQTQRETLKALIQKHGIPYFDGNHINPMGASEEEMLKNARERLPKFKIQRDQIKTEIKELAEKGNAQHDTATRKAVLDTKLKLVERQVTRMEEMIADRGTNTVDLPEQQHTYNQAKETYEQSRIMLREMKIKQAEARVLLKMPRDPITLHQKAK